MRSGQLLAIRPTVCHLPTGRNATSSKFLSRKQTLPAQVERTFLLVKFCHYFAQQPVPQAVARSLAGAFTAGLAAAESQHAPLAQQAASHTQGPPASQAQPSSAQAQSSQTHAAPQQQPALAAAVEESAEVVPAVTKPSSAARVNRIQDMRNLPRNMCSEKQIEQTHAHRRKTTNVEQPRRWPAQRAPGRLIPPDAEGDLNGGPSRGRTKRRQLTTVVQSRNNDG